MASPVLHMKAIPSSCLQYGGNAAGPPNSFLSFKEQLKGKCGKGGEYSPALVLQYSSLVFQELDLSEHRY